MRVAVLFAVLFAAGCGSKDKGGAADDRTFWKHARGHFEKRADGSWAEVAPDGSHTFTETARNADAVELSDKVRNITVTLHADHCVAKVGAYPPNRLYEGAWATRPAGTAESSAGAQWSSDPALAGKLAPETDVSGYRIRPPSGYNREVRTVENKPVVIWEGPRRPDHSTPKLWVMIGEDPSITRRPLEPGLKGLQTAVRWTLAGYRESPPERGQINGLDFLRISFKGAEGTGLDVQPAMGITYHAHDGDRYVHMKLLDSELHWSETSPVLEAAARSLRKP